MKPNLQEISDKLRLRLGITEEDTPIVVPIGTPDELFSLRKMLRLSRAQMGKRFGVTEETWGGWETGRQKCRPKDSRIRDLITNALSIAQELGALVAFERPVSKPSGPHYRRPPSNMQYRCSQCGQDVKWFQGRILLDENKKEVIWHGRKRCGPVQPEGLAHRASTLLQTQKESYHAS